ncbi:MAG: hypothetical protein LAT62_16105, partial [Natronospirillum sp.]
MALPDRDGKPRSGMAKGQAVEVQRHISGRCLGGKLPPLQSQIIWPPEATCSKNIVSPDNAVISLSSVMSTSVLAACDPAVWHDASGRG